jgi:ribosomal protein L23
MVDSGATKIDVKNAFKTLYGVDVSAVNVLYTRPKLHNTKKGIVEKKGIEKKAVVTLKNGQKIVNFETVK